MKASISNPPANVEKKADVYSFSVILWELLTLEIPWKDLDSEVIENSVRSGDRMPIPNDLGDNVRKTLILLMQKCWDGNPLERPDFDLIVQTIRDIQV